MSIVYTYTHVHMNIHMQQAQDVAGVLSSIILSLGLCSGKRRVPHELPAGKGPCWVCSPCLGSHLRDAAWREGEEATAETRVPQILAYASSLALLPS